MSVLQSKDVPASVKKAAVAASKAAGYLGEMYWRGEGVAPNPNMARKWFERGAAQNNDASHNGLGMMYLRGEAGLELDIRLGLEHLNIAAGNEFPMAMSNLAYFMMSIKKINLDLDKEKDWVKITDLFTKAAKKADPLGMYHLAKMFKDGAPGTTVNCQQALLYFKQLSEGFSWHIPFLSDGYRAFDEGDVETAFLYFLMAAEIGSEHAQLNAAWLLDTGSKFLI